MTVNCIKWLTKYNFAFLHSLKYKFYIKLSYKRNTKTWSEKMTGKWRAPGIKTMNRLLPVTVATTRQGRLARATDHFHLRATRSIVQLTIPWSTRHVHPHRFIKPAAQFTHLFTQTVFNPLLTIIFHRLTITL